MTELTASKTASCTIAPQRACKGALVGDTATVASMIAFQSVTVSACAALAQSAQATSTPANSSLMVVPRDAPLANQPLMPFNDIASLLGSALERRYIASARRPCAGRCRAGEELT